MTENKTIDSQKLWICCQLGAREHYAIPRALHKTEKLHSLITDAWVAPNPVANNLPGSTIASLRGRYHPDLATAQIKSFTASLIQFELKEKIARNGAWEKMISRNQWFQQKVIQHLKTLTFPEHQPPVLFAYSYASLEILKYAQSRGWQTILGQIDPGIEEENIVKAEKRKYPELAASWQPVPPSYWDSWLKECVIADQIMVNSLWSKTLLSKANISESKIKIAPLLYESKTQNKAVARTYPPAFTQEKPLQVLFLGLISIRKGISLCLEAIKQLAGKPIHFSFVGPIQVNIPTEMRDHPQISWVGPVPRSETEYYYKNSDIFLFPTLSDGFGLTQLEALSWNLPAIVSKNCGNVFEDQKTGFVLQHNTDIDIVKAFHHILQNPQVLQQMSDQIKKSPRRYDLNSFEFDI